MTELAPRRQRGRRRGFDRDEALRVAMHAFWRRGFDGVSIADLTALMGITAPSLYAAFGDKKALFHEAVAAYVATHGAFFDRAMAQEPTARAGVVRALGEAASEYTHPEHPRGCMVIAAAVNCTPASSDVEDALRERRRGNLDRLAARIQTDVDSGELPANTDARAMAILVATVLQGMSQQARDGATESELSAVAAAALVGWPDTRLGDR